MKYLFRPFRGFLIFILILCTISCEKTNEEKFETGTVTDFEGNNYPTIKIGNQWWMAKSLKATKYNNGDQIGTTIPYDLSITTENIPKYQWAYLDNEGFAAIYGRLYTWYTVTDARGICPTGWHLPTASEWNILTDYLINNGFGFEGEGIDIAKSMASNDGWLLHGIVGLPGNDQESNNSSGFSSLPGGMRHPTGSYLYAGGDSHYWSSTETGANLALYRLIDFDQTIVPSGSLDKKYGFSVRCVKDNF